MLGKLFNKNKTTENIGGKPAKVSKPDGMAKATYITIAGHPDKPSIRLEKKITIGSEVGDLIVADPNISPRHCSIFINKGILSIMDHSSGSGTFINKKQLDPGKIFILSNKDKIRIGKLDVKIELLDVPTSATKVIVPDEMSTEHFEDQTATRTRTVLTRSEEDLSAEVEEVKAVMDELPSMEEFAPPAFQEMQLGDEIEDDIDEMEEDVGDDNIDLTGVDVEEEDLDMSVLPIPVLERHQKENEKREQKLQEEAKKEVVSDADGEDLVGEYEVTASGIQLKRGEDGELSLGGPMEAEEIPSPGVKLSRAKIKEAAKARKKKDKKIKAKAKSKSKGSSKGISARSESSSFLTRTFALITDALICFIIIEIFDVYTDFKTHYDSIPSDVWSAIKPHFNEFVLPLFNEFVLPHYKTLVKEVPAIADGVKAITEYEKIDAVLSFVFFLTITRIAAGLIFSVSLGQLLVGMRSPGKALLKRLKYPIREIIGLLTLPLFFIFDLPALIKKRTFKEVITFSQYITPRRKTTAIAAIFFPIILSIILCLAPLVKGLEIHEPVMVKMDTKKLSKWEYKNPVYINALNITYDQTDDIYALPTFSLQLKNKKKRLKVGVVLVDLKTGGVVGIRKSKNFKLMDFYTSFVDLNFLAEEFQPEIFALARNVARKNDDFKFKINSPDKLALETVNLVKSTYSLNLETFPDFVLNNGIFMRGFRDFREKMDNLFSGKVQQIDLKQVGNYQGVMATIGSGMSAYYEFFPVGRVKGELYQFTTDMSSKKFTDIIKMIYWGEMKDGVQLKTNSVAKFIEAFSAKGKVTSRKVNQDIYESYFKVSKYLMKNNQNISINSLKYELTQLVNVLNEYAGKKDRLIQKLTQLLQALKDKDYRYFNLEDSGQKTVKI